MASTTISRSGGYEGSSETLTLTSKGGYRIIWSYEHYTIPDRFILMYGGLVILDTGFVGGSSSGTFELPPDQTVDPLSIVVATDDQGTAWAYSVTATDKTSTSPFILNGSFIEDKATGRFNTTGSVIIGRDDGLGSLVSVSGGGYYDATKFSLGGTFTVNIGGISGSLFSGSYSTAFASGTGAVIDNGNNGSGEFKLGSVDISVSSMTINPRDVRAVVSLVLPHGLGDVALSGQTLIFKETGVFLGINGKVSVPDASFKFLNLFNVKATDTTLSYDHSNRMLKYQGGLKLSSFAKLITASEIELDLKGDNYVGISPTQIEVVGSMTYERELKVGSWGLKKLNVTVDTVGGTVGGSVTVTLPLKVDVQGSLEFLVTPNLQLNSVGIAFKEINKRLGFAPAIYLQSIGGTVEHMAKNDTAPVSFTGSLEFTAGPKINNKALVTMGLQATLDATHVEGTGSLEIFDPEVLSGTGTYNWNFQEGHINYTGAVNVLDGLIVLNEDFSANSNFDFTFGGTATLTIPDWIPFLGGSIGANANYRVTYLNNGTLTDDFAAVWFQKSYTVLGITKTGTVGVRVGFDRSISRIGFDSIPSSTPLFSTGLGGIGGAVSAPQTFTAPGDGSGPLFMSVEWSISQVADVAVRVIGPTGQMIEAADFAANGIEVVEELSSPNSKMLAVSSPGTGSWTIEVVDASALGTVTYWGGILNDAPEVSIETVTGPNTAGLVDVAFTAADTDSDAVVSFYYGTDAAGAGAILAGTVAEQDTSGTFTWNTEGLADGTYYLHAVIDDGNNAEVTAYSSTPIVVSRSADLSITVAPPTTTATGAGTYLVTVANAGISDAANVIVNQVVPLGFRIASSTTPATFGNGGAVSFAIGALSAGATSTFSIELERATGVLIMNAGAGNDTPQTATNLDQQVFSLQSNPTIINSDTLPHLTIEASGDGTIDYYSFTVTDPDSTFVFDIDGTNGWDSFIRLSAADGTSLATSDDGSTDVGSTSRLDSNLTYTFATAGFYTLGVFRYPGNSGVEAGKQYKLHVSRPLSSADQNAIETTVSSTTYDADQENNSASTPIVLTGPELAANLSVTATALPSSLSIGSNVSYTVTVTNTGPDTATDVILDQVVTNIGNLRYTLSQGTYASVTDGIQASLGSIASGQSVTIGISGTVFAAGAVRTESSVVSAVNDADTTNNSASQTVIVAPSAPLKADLSLDLDLTDRDSLGRQIVSVTLTNDGPGIASGASVRIPMVPGTTLVSSNAIQGTYDSATGIWNVGNIRDGVSRTLFLVIDGTAVAASAITATLATATSSDPDSTAGNALYTEDDQVLATLVTGRITGQQGSLSADAMTGGASAEAFHGREGNDTVTAGAGNDILFGDAGADLLLGEAGNDTLFGGIGNDTINGGADVDTVSYADTYLAVTVRLDTATKTAVGAGIGTDTLVNIENVVGGLANDVIYGDGLANVLDGGAGTDQLRGGLGNDTYVLANGFDLITDTGGTDTITTTISRSLANYTAIENLLLLGSGAINATGNDVANVLRGNTGANTLTGGGGNDTLIGGAGADKLDGGLGIDTAVYTDQTLSVTVRLDTATKTATGAGTGTDTLISIENVVGGSGSDMIYGDAQANVLDGGAGADQLRGGLGNDTYVLSNGTDTVIDTGGIDTITSTISRSLAGYAAIEKLTLLGTAAINGTGNSSANVIIGNAAANVLTGGAGNDTLTGGAGKDMFVFASPLNSATNIDTITDFVAADDTIKLENTGVGLFTRLTKLGALTAAEFVSGAGLVAAKQSSNRVIYNTTTGNLYYDADGTGTASSAVLFATLSTHPTINSGNIVVI